MKEVSIRRKKGSFARLAHLIPKVTVAGTQSNLFFKINKAHWRIMRLI
jgi:hypothetical protein